MNTIASGALQASFSPPAHSFQQPIPAVIAAMSASAAAQAILHLFDAGAIGAAIAEDWLITIETSEI